MTLKEALEEICIKQVPEEINGVRTKFIIEERPRMHDGIELYIVIAPADFRRENLAATVNFNPYLYEQFENYDFEPNSTAYKMLERDIEQMLLLFIRNIISYFEGKTVEVIKLDIDDLLPYREECERE